MRRNQNVRNMESFRNSNVRQSGMPRRKFLETVAAGVGAAAMAGAGVVHATGTTLHVPSSAYPTIQDAVDAAGAGDTIMVAPGNYAGAMIPNLYVPGGPNPQHVDKTGLKIIGSGPDTVIDQPHSRNGGFSIYGPGTTLNNPSSDPVDTTGVEISNLTIDGRNFTIDSVPSGIFGFRVNNVKINNLDIFDTYRYAIYLRYANGWTVTDNKIEIRDLDDPFILPSSLYGIFLQSSASNNVIQFNEISFISERGKSGARYIGITFQSFGSMMNNVIHRNDVVVSIAPDNYLWCYGMVLYDRLAIQTGEPGYVQNNQITGNQLKNSCDSILLIPDVIASVNSGNVISENLGNLRSLEVATDWEENS